MLHRGYQDIFEFTVYYETWIHFVDDIFESFISLHRWIKVYILKRSNTTIPLISAVVRAVLTLAPKRREHARIWLDFSWTTQSAFSAVMGQEWRTLHASRYAVSGYPGIHLDTTAGLWAWMRWCSWEMRLTAILQQVKFIVQTCCTVYRCS